MGLQAGTKKQSQECQLAAELSRPFPLNEIEMHKNNVILFSNDDSSATIADRETEPDETQSQVSHSTDAASNCSTLVIPKESSHGFTVDQHCETDLAKLLNDKHVPHGLHQEVLE